MNENMKCPKCDVIMEKGMMLRTTWISGEPELGKSLMTGLIKIGAWPIKRTVTYVTAWKCPSCGKVELYADKNK